MSLKRHELRRLIEVGVEPVDGVRHPRVRRNVRKPRLLRHARPRADHLVSDMARRRTTGIYQHGKGWKFAIKDPASGKWKQLTATRARFQELAVPLARTGPITRSDVTRLRDRYQSTLEQACALQVVPTGSGVLLGEAISDYLRFQRNTPAYLKDKKRVLSEFRELVGDRDLRDITKQDIGDFERTLGDEERALHPTSIARYLRYVSTFFNYAVREGWISRSPFVNFTLPQDKSTPIEVYSIKELCSLVKVIRDSAHRGERDYVIWMLHGFLGLGLRVMELEGLNWEDFDQEERFVHITKTKNSQSLRPQPIPAVLLPEFTRRQRESGPMFPTQSGVRASLNQMKTLGRRVSGRVPGFSFRRLRRTYATLLQAGGVDALIIDRLLGHSSRTSTLRVSASHYIGKEYTFYRGLVDEALEPLGEVFAKELG